MIDALAAGLVLGLGSAAHCGAMCGPLAAFACSARRGRYAWLRYTAGRWASYAALGAALGALSEHVMPWLRGTWAAWITSWLLAAALALSAWRFWSTVALRPAALVTLGRAKTRERRTPSWLVRLGESFGRLPPAGVGAAQALLPCGALAAALMLAAAQGSALHGALAMTGFVGASGVGLVGLGLSAGALSRLRSPVASRALAVGLAVAAVFMFVRPLPSLRARAEQTRPAAAACPLHDGTHPPQ